MDFLDWILVLIRWGHALGAVAWVGGGMFYILVIRPAFRRAQPPPETSRAIGQEFRGLVNTAIMVLLITGVILAAARLTVTTVTTPYAVVLAVKIALALYMFYIVRFLRYRAYPEDTATGGGWWSRTRRQLTSTTAILVIGVVVFGLSGLLGALFEGGLAQ
jgi:putative copper export protein